MIEYGKALDRLNELYERLGSASREELPRIRRELEEARAVRRKELGELERLAKQAVQRRHEIKAELLAEVAAIAQQSAHLPEEAATELRQRCDRLRSLVQEWR